MFVAVEQKEPTLIIELQVGTVIAGMQLSSLPHTPSSMTRLKFGKSSRHWSKTSSGGAQSRPITRTYFRRFMNKLQQLSQNAPGIKKVQPNS
jgi:hypothetical protein